MAGNGSVFRLRRSFPNRDGIDDLTPGLSVFAGMARAAHASFRPQVIHKRFFQYSSRLNEQAAVDGLVGPEICSGDQSRISLLATMFRNLRFLARRHLFGRRAESQAWSSASWAR